MAHKKSFVLYFDDFPCVEALPSDQRGELLSLLFRYAIAEDRAPTEPMELADQVPGLTDQTRMAFQFIAKTIRRDTMNWKEKEYRYQTAARRRMAKRSGGESIRRRDFQPERGDNSWMRKYIMRDEGAPACPADGIRPADPALTGDGSFPVREEVLGPDGADSSDGAKSSCLEAFPGPLGG